MNNSDKILDDVLPIIRIQRGIPNKLLAVFSNELVFGFSFLKIDFKEAEISRDIIQSKFSSLFRLRQIGLNNISKVYFIKPNPGRLSDKSWRIIIYSNFGARRLVLPFEDGHNIFEYFRSKMPERLEVEEDSAAHFLWRLRTAFLLFIFGALFLGSALFILSIFIPEILVLLFILLPAGFILLFIYVILPRNTLIPEEEAGQPKLKKEKKKTEPFTSPLLSWTLKIVGIGWFFLCNLVIVQQEWFRWLDYKTKGAQNGLYLLLYMPTALLVYLGYQLSQNIQKKVAHSEASPNILYLRAFDDDQRITLQPTTLLAKSLGLIDSMPNDWGNNYGLDGARFKTVGNFAMFFNPIRIIRLFFNKGADTSEEIISAYFSKLGNVIAIGQPGQRLLTPGAKRIYVEDDDWQTEVLDYLTRSQIIIIQPGISAGVRWEIIKTFELVPPERILLSMVCFWRRPNTFENFLLTLPENLRQKIPREIPFLDRPSFLYFEKEGTPRLQLINYRSPILWAFLGNAVDLRHTLKSFLQGINGEPREKPTPPKKHFGHQSVAWSIAALLIAFIVWSVIIDYEDLSFREHIQTSPLVEYKGAKVPYSIKLQRDWNKLEMEDSSESSDYVFSLNKNSAFIRVSSYAESFDVATFSQDRLIGLRKDVSLALAEIKIKSSDSLIVDGRKCIKTQIEIKSETEGESQEYSLACSGSKGTVIIYAVIPLDDSLYLKLVEEIFASLKFN